MSGAAESADQKLNKVETESPFAVERNPMPLRRVAAKSSPKTRILIDEAYIDYTHDPAVKTAAPLAKELSGVFVKPRTTNVTAQV